MEELKTVNSMDGIDYLIAKLYRQPDIFRDQYYQKDWAAAKYTYDTAVRVALFLELPEDERNKLFGSSQGYPENVIEGLFPAGMVDKVYLECAVKRDLGHESQRMPPSPYYPYEKSR